MQVIQLHDGTPIPALSMDVSITDTPQKIATLVSNDLKDPRVAFAYIYVAEGTLSLSTRSDCPAGEGIAVPVGKLVTLRGYPEITKYYLRTYSAGATVTVSIELEER